MQKIAISLRKIGISQKNERLRFHRNTFQTEDTLLPKKYSLCLISIFLWGISIMRQNEFTEIRNLFAWKWTFYQNFIKPDLFRKVIPVIRQSSMFSGINYVIKFHFTRGCHKTYFFEVLHSSIWETEFYSDLNVVYKSKKIMGRTDFPEGHPKTLNIRWKSATCRSAELH